MSFVKQSIFSPLIDVILQSQFEQTDFGMVAKVFELCACNSQGISIITKNLDQVVSLCDIFMMPTNDIILVRYPAATVLLDLTASETCIERVASLIMQNNLIPLVLSELK